MVFIPRIYGDQPTEFILYAIISVTVITFIWKLQRRFGYDGLLISIIFLGLSLYGLASYLYGGAYFLSADGATYVRQAQDIIIWFQDQSHTFQISRWKYFWPSLIAVVYSCFGSVPLVIILINVIFVTLSAILIYKLSAPFCKNSPNWSFAALFLLNPIILLFAISTGREAVFWFSLSVAIFGVSLLLTRSYVRGSLIFLSGAILAALTRPTLSLPIIYFLIISTVLYIGFEPYARSKLRIFISACISIFIAVTALPLIPLLKEDTERIPASREALSRTASTAISEQTSVIINSSSGDQTLGYISSSISNFLRASVGPFPQELGTEAVWVLFGIVNIWWICFLIFSALGFKNNMKRALPVILTATAVFTLSILAWTLSNYGILFRFRGAVMFELLPLSVIGISKLRANYPLKKIIP